MASKRESGSVDSIGKSKDFDLIVRQDDQLELDEDCCIFVSSSPVGSSSYALSFADAKSGETWADMKLSRPLMKAVTAQGFRAPTPIQIKAIPLAIAGRDIIATAETGSGKTAAFLLPMLERLLQSPALKIRTAATLKRNNSQWRATKCLVLMPTRELALQCSQMLLDLAVFTPITSLLVTGGTDTLKQVASLSQQPDIVIATPGRILDALLNAPNVHMDLLEIVVLDEADKLLEFGFKDECLAVLRHCAHARQTLLLSATLSDDVKNLAALALDRPVSVRIKSSTPTVKSLDQEFVSIPNENPRTREAMLLHLCSTVYQKRCIVFFPTKRLAHRMLVVFEILGLNATELHGNMSQANRFESLERFTRGKAEFLLASELASRGLDIDGVEAVINFAPPMYFSRYLHRVGRTARMGSTGRACTMYSASEKLTIKRIARCVGGKAKLLQRKVPNASVQSFVSKIGEIEEQIRDRITSDMMEKQLRLADMECRKAKNLYDFQDEIAARPAKIWFQTPRERYKVRKEDRQEDKNRSSMYEQHKGNNSTNKNKVEMKVAAHAKFKKQKEEESRAVAIAARKVKKTIKKKLTEPSSKAKRKVPMKKKVRASTEAEPPRGIGGGKGKHKKLGKNAFKSKSKFKRRK